MTTEIVGREAHELDRQIVACNYNVRANFLKMAELLVKMRDEKLYRALDHLTFESYLGTLGAEGNRAWLYKLIRAWETFSKRLGVPDAQLIEIGPSKLDIIAPVVNAANKDEWLDGAAVLSKSDLIAEVRQVQGKPPLTSLPAPRGQINPGLSDLLKYKSYTEYVKDSPCVVCGAVPVDPHHWPVTKGAGGKEVEEWVIPLCRGCHTEFQDHKLKFLNDYSHNWAAYYYGLILKIWETA